MTRASFPEIPPESLKSHAEPARVERVWRRLELDVTGVPRARVGYLWAPVLAAAIFGLGVAVGTRLQRPAMEVAAVAEPSSVAAAPGAGPALEGPGPQTTLQKDAPSRKRARVIHPIPVAEGMSDSYAELPRSAASEPVTVVEFAEWEKLAEAGDFSAARAALDREGGFERAVARASANQLLVLADIARASGEREQATRALKRVLSSYVSAPEAPLAAWTLGNLLEQAGDKSGAADAYATYRRLSPTGDFAEDAAARQVDAALSQGNLELGRRALEEYAQHFPKGRRVVELRKRLAALEAPADAAGPAPTEPEDDDDGAEPGLEAPASAPHER